MLVVTVGKVHCVWKIEAETRLSPAEIGKVLRGERSSTLPVSRMHVSLHSVEQIRGRECEDENPLATKGMYIFINQLTTHGCYPRLTFAFIRSDQPFYEGRA
jgi:hypothetical protein